MPSPFPGMDPYLEGLHWQGFHHLLCTAIARQLTPKLGDKYVALPDVWLVAEETEGITIAKSSMWPDVSVVRESRAHYGTATLEPPLRMSAPLNFVDKVPYIEIRRVGSNEVVTVIELLSIANKQGSS